MAFPDFPVPTGIFRRVRRPVYEQRLEAQVAVAQEATGGQAPSMAQLFDSPDAWTVS